MRRVDNRLIFIIGLILIGSIVLVSCVGLERDKLVEESEAVELTEEEIIALVKEDLAARKGIEVGEIGHPSVEQQTWSTSALGCPEEGMVYADAITPGYRILLAIGGPASIEQFDYRTDTMGNFILCEG